MSQPTTAASADEQPEVITAQEAAQRYLNQSVNIDITNGTGTATLLAVAGVGYAVLTVADAIVDVAAAVREVTAYAKLRDKPKRAPSTRTSSTRTKPSGKTAAP